MSIINQIAFTLGIMANTVSILLLCRSHFRMHNRIGNLECELYALKFISTGLRKEYGYGVPSMAEDTKVAE
jgi:hypothetical protein